jgi:hypothetical protein
MEVDHEDFRREGFFFDEHSFRLDLYRLLSCFYASTEFSKCRGQLKLESVAILGNEFEEYEIARLLVNISAKIRMIQDREKEYFKKLIGVCGKLTPDLSTPNKKENLSFREACNKIIHAKHFKFDVKNVKVRDSDYSSSQPALRPFIHLYGEKYDDKKKCLLNWKASLNVVDFSKIGAIHVKG